MAMSLSPDVWSYIISFLHESHLEPLSLVCKTLLSITNLNKKNLKITTQTAKHIKSLLNRFPNLKHLDFSEFTNNPTDIIKELAHFDLRIETLDLSTLTFPIKELPAAIFSGLKSFKVDPGRSHYDVYIDMIVTSFPNLEELHLTSGRCYFSRHQDKEKPYGPYLTLSHLKGLRAVNFDNIDWIKDDIVCSFSESLEEFSLQKCRNVTRVGIRSALELNNLKKIRLEDEHYWTVYGVDHRDLRWSRMLTEIDFTLIEVSDDLLSSMVKADLPLKRVSLDSCMKLTNEGMMLFFKWYDDLDYLALVKVGFLEDSSIRALSKRFKRLKHLKMNKCKGLSDASLLTLIKQCLLLEQLEMKQANLGSHDYPSSFKVVNSCIRALNLSGNANLSDESLSRIVTACPSLESLKLKGCIVVTCNGVGEVMRNCLFLKDLNICGCVEVKKLDMEDNDTLLASLDASKTSLDNRGLTEIANKCPNLKLLKLSKCLRLTSQGVTQLVIKCTKLEEIELDGCIYMSNMLLSWMICTGPSLRRIVPPRKGLDENFNLYLRYGCYVTGFI